MSENTLPINQRAGASWGIGSALEDIEGKQINMVSNGLAVPACNIPAAPETKAGGLQVQSQFEL